MTSLPKTEAWKTAPLDTTPMSFNMFVTGNCAAPENKDIIITGSTQVPDFFDVSDGQFVFRKPTPMATIQVPAGYGSTYLTITLEGVTNDDFSNIKNYVALGVREKAAAAETYSAILNVNSKASECFYIDTNNVVELVPLISSVDMSSGEYTAVTTGNAITTCPALSGYADTSFDFGALFGVSTECEEANDNAAWTELQWNSGNIAIESGGRFLYSEGLFLYSSSGGTLVLPPNTIDERAVRQWTKADGIESSVNGLFYLPTFAGSGTFFKKSLYVGIHPNSLAVVSEDGSSWAEFTYDGTKHANIYESELVSSCGWGDFLCCAQVAANNCWGIMQFNGMGCHNGLGWELRSRSLIPNLVELSSGNVIHLVYGDEVMVAATSNCYVSIGSGIYFDVWTEPQQKPGLSGTLRGLAYGSGKFLAVNSNGDLFSSTNKGETWQEDGKVGTGNICGLVFDDEAFYAMDGVTGNVYRHVAVDAIELTRK